VKGKVGESLRAHLDQLKLAKALVTIKTDCELHDLPKLTFSEPDIEALLPMLKEYNLDSWLKTLNIETEAIAQPEIIVAKRSHTYQLIQNEKELKPFIAKLKQQAYFAFDTETDDLDALRANLVGISFSFKNDEAYFIILRHQIFHPSDAITADASQVGESQDNAEWLMLVFEQLKPIFADPLIGKIAHNAKFDIKVMHSHGVDVTGLLFDTLLASYVLNSTERHSLEAVANRELGLQGLSFQDLVGSGRNKITLEQVPIERLNHYACEDADFTWQLYEKLRHQIDQAPKLKNIFQNLEMPLLEILAEMEEYGVLLDIKKLNALSTQWQTRLETISEIIFKEVGHSFNLASPKQLIEVLFGKLQLPVTQKTPKGEPSTNEAALMDLADLHPVPKLLLEHRHLSKLKNTYVDKLPTMLNPKTKRIHTQYQQAIVATGRLSSTDPNLQNIPFKTDTGKEIRKAFIAAPNSVLISADYSQVELRIMAHLSGDTGLIEAFHQGKDIHRATAAEVLGIPEAEVTQDQRRHAKAVNFGLIYGMSAFGLAKQLGVSRHDAHEYIQLYFARYPGVLKYMEATRELAHQQGYVETIMGRRLYLPTINSKNGMERKAAERAAINAPMQGTAADIIKKAMVDFDHWLKSQVDLNAHLIMQVHDELVVEVSETHKDAIAENLRKTMENAVQLDVPLLVDLEIGSCWS